MSEKICDSCRSQIEKAAITYSSEGVLEHITLCEKDKANIIKQIEDLIEKTKSPKMERGED